MADRCTVKTYGPVFNKQKKRVGALFLSICQGTWGPRKSIDERRAAVARAHRRDPFKFGLSYSPSELAMTNESFPHRQSNQQTAKKCQVFYGLGEIQNFCASIQMIWREGNTTSSWCVYTYIQ